MIPEQESKSNPAKRERQGDAELVRKSRVLFIGTHNSARSPMAEGYHRAKYRDLFDVGSAGTEVRRVNPVAVFVMEEKGIEISGHPSRLIDEFFDRRTGIVMTVCESAYQSCTFFPGAKTTIHAAFPDLSSCTGTPEECLTQFRQVRDAIIVLINSPFVPECKHRHPFS